MSKLFTLGVILSAKDMLSPVLKKTDKNLDGLAAHTKKLNANLIKSTAASSKFKKEISDLDQRLRAVKSRRFRLKEDFDQGRISAERFRQKLSIIDRQERVLSKRRLRLDMDLKRATTEATNLERTLGKIERRQRAIARLDKISKGLTYGGTALTGLGVVTRRASSAPVSAFADLEEARTTLQMTMMDRDGNIPKSFAQIDRQAVELGNKLPGTTKDFYELAASMRALGVSDKSITGGVLKSAAYLAVVLKSKGVSYQEAGEAAAKFKEAMGIADGDMLRFIDLIQRTAFTGVKLQEMQYAFSKVGATMKGMGVDGYDAAKKMVPFIGMLIKAGFTGETVGTNLGSAMQRAVTFHTTKAAKKLKKAGIDLKFVDANGKFVGLERMIAILEAKTKALNDVQKTQLLASIFGSGESMKMMQVLISQGVKGYKSYLKQMEKQADIDKRVAKATSTLNASWEALTGTFENLLAILGENVAPALKEITTGLNDFADKVGTLAKEHPQLTRAISYGVVGFSAFATVIGGSMIALRGFLWVAKSALSPIRIASKAIGVLSGASNKSCGAFGCLSTKASRAATGIGTLNKKTGILRKLFASPLTLTVTIAGVAAVLAGLSKIAEATHQAIMDKRYIAAEPRNIDAIKKRIKRLETRLHDARGDNGTLAKAYSLFMYRDYTNAGQKELRKLILSAKKQLAIAEAKRDGTYKQNPKPEQTVVQKSDQEKAMRYASKIKRIWALPISPEKKRTLALQLTKNIDMPIPKIRRPIVDPVVKQAVVSPKTTQPAISPKTKEAIVTPTVRQAVVDPVVKQAVVSPKTTQPTISPKTKEVVVTPKIRRPIVDPVVKQAVVSPKTTRQNRETSIKEALHYQATTLKEAIASLKSTPQQHIYHVAVNVQQASKDIDVEAAVRRALDDARYQSEQRSFYDR